MKIISFHKLAFLILGFIVAFCIDIASIAIPAEAEETKPYTTVDQSFYFNFGYWGDTQYTASVSKDDSSATYIGVWVNTTSGVHLYVDGYDSTGWNTNLTQGSYAYLSGGTTGQFWIHNYVYENGYRTARLRGMADSSGVLSGEWSPDSTGTYTSLN